MPDSDGETGQHVGLANQLSRVGEQVARMDGRVSAQIEALKNDTETIRRSLHDTNQTMTEVVAVWRGHGVALTALTDDHRTFREGLDKMSGIAAQFLMHVQMCDNRGKRMERAAWGGLAVLVAILGFLLAPYFGHRP